MNICSRCGNDIRSEDVFCGNCGLELKQAKPPTSKPPTSEYQLPRGVGSWRTLRWILAIGIVILPILGVPGLLFLQRQTPVVVTVVVTATSSPTRTNTPGPSPTPKPTDTPQPSNTPRPTSTPTPTTTPIPTTEPGTVLKPGETWRQGDMAMRVERHSIVDQVCETVFSGHYVWGRWDVVIQNHAGHDLHIDLDEADFYLVNDKGKASGFTVKSQDDCVPDRNRANIPFLKSGEEVRLYVFAIGELEDQDWFEFSATKIGRIENARWQMEIPR